MTVGKKVEIDKLANRISFVFSAGCFGGLLNSLVVWIFGAIGITSLLGVKIAPLLSASWLYPRLVWGIAAAMWLKYLSLQSS